MYEVSHFLFGTDGPSLRNRRRHSRRDRTEETIKTSAGTTFRQIYTVVGCRRATSDQARFDGGGGGSSMSDLHTMPTGVVRAIYYRRQWINRGGCARGVRRWHGPETMRPRQQVVDLFLSPPDTNTHSTTTTDNGLITNGRFSITILADVLAFNDYYLCRICVTRSCSSSFFSCADRDVTGKFQLKGYLFRALPSIQ